MNKWEKRNGTSDEEVLFFFNFKAAKESITKENTI